jgi:hypothetical protein
MPVLVVGLAGGVEPLLRLRDSAENAMSLMAYEYGKWSEKDARELVGMGIEVTCELKRPCSRNELDGRLWNDDVECKNSVTG